MVILLGPGSHYKGQPLAFLDEDDSFPPVATEPEETRVPPERQRVFMVRRLAAVGVGILILILLVLGIRGCLNARKERAFENYVSDLTTLTDQSNQLSAGFFARLDDPKNLTELQFETEIRADRSTAEGLLSRAEDLDPPGDLSGAQEQVELAFELRRDALGAIADNVGAAFGNEDPLGALAQITDQMSDFLASDVLYRRARDEIAAVLSDEGISEKVPESDFFPRESDGAPDLEWLDETTISEKLAGVTGTEAEGAALHGLGITSVLVNGTDVSPDTDNTVSGNGNPEVEVAVTNQGDTEESDVNVEVSVSGEGEPISSEETIPKLDPAATETATVPLDPAPPTGTPVTIEVFVPLVLGEQVSDDNEFSYDVTFE
jgi:hypothetical protein